MAARLKPAANRLNEFPQSAHENRFSAAAAVNKENVQNIRSKSFHGKCVCDICTCGKHRCPPSVSPNKYPSDMRSTSQDNFRPYKPDEVRKANTFGPTKSPAHKETGGVFPTQPTKDRFQTSNQVGYPNYWANNTLDPRQLRYSPKVSANQRTFDIFPNEPVQDQFQPIASKPQNQKPYSPNSKERSPSASNTRGRPDNQLPRRANDMSPDFPLNQSGKIYGADVPAESSSSINKSPFRGDKNTGAGQRNQDRASGYYGDEEQGPKDPSDKNKKRAQQPQSRTPPGDKNRRIRPGLSESQTDMDQTIGRGDPRRGSGRLGPQSNQNFDSINSGNPEDQDTLVPKAKKDRYGPAKGLPRPQTNQQTLLPHNREDGSPPKMYAGLATKRPKDTNIISHEQPIDESARGRRIPKEPAVEIRENEEDSVPTHLTPRRQPGARADNKPLSQSEVFNPFDNEGQRDLRTPVKDQRRRDQRPEEIADESARKSPMRSSTPTRMKREDNLQVDRSLPLAGESTYNQDFDIEQLKPRAGTGQLAGKPALPTEAKEGEDRVFGKIKSLKYNDIKTVYQDDFKDVMVSNFMKKDCPILGLPKPPKVITTGKLHVYYDEEENYWN